MDDLISRKEAIDAVKHAWAKGLEPSQYIETIPSASAVPLEPLAEWIVDNLDPRCTCELCKSDPENAYRECVNDDCPHMTEQQVKELLVKWMEEQNA